ncbi:MAG: hypothetical protein WCH83_05300 [Alphaproteobacteria bacterium]
MLSLALGACAPQGDFGRPAPSVINDTALPFVGSVVARGREEPVSSFDLTDAEKALRTLAYAFVMHIHPRDHFNAFLAEMRRTRIAPRSFAPNPEGYCSTLVNEHHASAKSRFRRIADDIAADRLRISPFFAKAAEVAEGDRVRLGALTYITTVTPQEVADARARVAENAMIVGWVRQGLANRVIAYRCALNQLVVATPEPEAVIAERELAGLEAALRALDAAEASRPRAEITVEPISRPFFPGASTGGAGGDAIVQQK